MNKLEPVDEQDSLKSEAEDRWQIVPNREDFRRRKLTLRRRRAGYFRRQAIKSARLAHRVGAKNEVVA